jgi:uncharacterized protein (DUF1330 family)
VSAFIIVDTKIKNTEAYREYIEKVPAMIARHGGQYRARGGLHTVKEGNWNPTRLVLIEFPDRQAIEAFFEDPDYQAIIHVRLENTDSNLVILDGL